MNIRIDLYYGKFSYFLNSKVKLVAVIIAISYLQLLLTMIKTTSNI